MGLDRGTGRGLTAEATESDSDDAEGCFNARTCCLTSKKTPRSGCCEPQADEIRFSDTGLIHGTLSHDGSVHVTDEVFNSASHLFGGMMSVLGTAVLVAGASAAGNPWAVVGFSLYGSSLIFLFFASFAHHAIKGSDKLMKTLRMMDYVAIYFLIPGTMIPVCLVCLHEAWIGWVFLGTSVGLAVFGVLMETSCSGGLKWPMWASMTMYVTLGWFGAFLAVPAMHCIGMGGATLLLLGGLAYTGGGMIFTLQCPNPWPGKFGFHEIWHVCVLAGAAFHYAAIFFYVWPSMLVDGPGHMHNHNATAW